MGIAEVQESKDLRDEPHPTPDLTRVGWFPLYNLDDNTHVAAHAA